MKNIKKIIIIGASDFGREVLWTIHNCNAVTKQFDVLGFVDDNENLKNLSVKNIPILGNMKWLLSSDEKDFGCVVAIGDSKRKQVIVKSLEENGFYFPNIISPTANLNEDVKLGNGVIIQHGTIVSVDVKIGNHVYINYNCTIGHDCLINDFATLAPGTQINGGCVIDERVYIGSGAITKNDIKIGKDSVIGAGSIVSKDLPEKSMCFAASGILKNFKP